MPRLSDEGNLLVAYMDEISKKQIIKKTLSYLGANNKEGEERFSEEILEAYRELQKETHFRMCYEIYELQKNGDFYEIPKLMLTLKSQDISTYFDGCEKVCVILSSLGVEGERFIKRIQAVSMSHGLVVDACAGAYLELMTDAVEEELKLGERTYRFCPGYGDLPIELNQILLDAINGSKRVGVTNTGGGGFIPQKSMLGLIGLGKKNLRKNCGSCIRRTGCSLLKEGSKCWI